MSQPHTSEPHVEEDVADTLVHRMHWFLPLAGAVLIFLLALIAVTLT